MIVVHQRQWDDQVESALLTNMASELRYAAERAEAANLWYRSPFWANAERLELLATSILNRTASDSATLP